MLGKLMKHELKLTAKKLLPMYLVFAVITILAKLTMVFSDDSSIFVGAMESTIMSLVQVLLLFLYVIALVAISIMTYFVILNRFYKNLLGDEGYLMFTLPVKTSQLINSKLFTAFIWLALLAPVAILSFLILFMDMGIFNDISYYTTIFAEDITLTPLQTGLIAFGLLLSAAAESVVTILACYLSMTLGQRFWHEHRLFGSVLFYFLISTVHSILVNIMSALMENVVLDVYYLGSVSDVINYYSLYLPGMILINVICIIALYALIHHLLDKKLNLN